MAYREREKGRRIPPTPWLWRQGEALGSSSAGAQPAGLQERGRDGPHPEAVRVPPGGGRGEGIRHEPRLERGSSRILQKLSWQWAGRLHRPGSLVWDFSAGREDRGPAPSIPSRLSWALQEDWVGISERSPPPPLCRWKTEVPGGKMCSPRSQGFQVFYEGSTSPSFIHLVPHLFNKH